MNVFERFTHESKLGGALTGLIDLVLAGLLWLALCAPVVTAGPASTALYYVVVRVIRHERGRLLPTFFGCFKQNFRQSLLLWLLCLAYVAVGFADRYALSLMGFGPDTGAIIYDLSLIYFLPAVLILPWLFPFASRFHNTVPGTLKFAAYLALKNLGRTLLLAAFAALFVVLAWLLPFLAPLFPGVCCFFQSLVIEPVFRSLTASAEKDDNADQWYNE